MTRRFTVLDVPQRSPEWFQARLGKITGSRAHDILKTQKSGKPAASRENYRVQLMLERVTGKNHESTFQSDAMRQGIEREADAMGLYEALTGKIVARSGFLSHRDYEAGCSVDGYVGDYEGVVEAKCPIPATHWEYLRTGVVPIEYGSQVLHNLFICGAQWCDWISYNPDFPPPLDTKMVRIARNEALIRAYEIELKMFLAEVAAGVADVRRMVAGR